MRSGERVLAAVHRAVTEVNQHLSDENKISQFVDTQLVGDSGHLDSLRLISLLVAIEQEIEKEFNLEISLTDDEGLFSETNGPLHTIETLVHHISQRVQA